MNTPSSREGNLIRYIVYLIGYFMVIGTMKLVMGNSPLRVWDTILYGLVTSMVLLLYVYRFGREQRFFERANSLPWLGDFGLTISITLGIVASRILVMYLQTQGKIPVYSFSTIYLKHESTSLFWYLMIAQGIVLPILQEFLATGFLFNYLFRDNTRAVAVLGIVISGILFSLFNFQGSIALFLVNAAYGMVYAWIYLYTQTLRMPMYLAILSGVLTIIMI